MDGIGEQSRCKAHLSTSTYSFRSKGHACSQSALYLNGEQERHDVTPAHHSRGPQGHNDSPGSRDISILCLLTHVAARLKTSLQSSAAQTSAWLILTRVAACVETRSPFEGSHISILCFCAYMAVCIRAHLQSSYTDYCLQSETAKMQQTMPVYNACWLLCSPVITGCSRKANRQEHEKGLGDVPA